MSALSHDGADAPDCQVVVVGAGMVGVQVALRLAERGASVTLIDAVGPAAGTSGTTGALIGASDKLPAAYHRLGLAGMQAMRRLAAELHGNEWYLPTGHLEWASTPETTRLLDERIISAKALGYPIQHLTRREAAALEPDLIIPPEANSFTSYPQDGIIYPLTAIALSLRRLRELDAALLFGVGECRLLIGPDGIRGVRAEDGTVVEGDVVINCTGRWTSQFLRDVGDPVPIVQPRSPLPKYVGFQVITTPVAVDMRRMVRMPGLSLRPAGGGRLMLHGRPEEVSLHQQDRRDGLKWDEFLDPLPPQAVILLEKARAVLRYADRMQVQSAALSIRALTVDGLPAVGWVPQVPNLYSVVTHSGIVLGPLLGELVAAEILHDPQPLLSPFRNTRFVSLGSSTDAAEEEALPANAPTN